MYVFLVFPLEFVLHSMNAARGIVWLFRRIRTTCGTLAANLRGGPETKPLSHPLPSFVLDEPEPVPTDPSDHAEDFALRHFEPLEDYSRRRMRRAGHPRKSHRCLRRRFRFPACRLLSQGADGGENSPGARINLNSGVLNPKLLASMFGPAASELWEKGRLRDRIDAVIVHEDIEGLKVVEGQGFEAVHTAALIQGPETARPITEGGATSSGL